MKLSKKINAMALFMVSLVVFVFAAESDRLLSGKAKVKGSKASGQDFEYGYQVHVDIEVNAEGKIVKVSDKKQKTEASIKKGTKGRPEHNMSYWQKYLKGKGFEKFKNKTLNDVIKMNMSQSKTSKADAVGSATKKSVKTDAVAGATASSLAVKNAIINAFALDMAITELENYKKIDGYKQAEQKKLKEIINSGKKLLEQQETAEDIEKVLKNLKNNLNALKTK